MAVPATRPAPLAAGAAVLLCALVVLVVKPWGAPAAAGPVQTSVPVVLASAARATPAPSAVDRRLPRPRALERAAERAIERHDRWGVRLLVDGDPSTTAARDELDELWVPAAPPFVAALPSPSGGTGDRVVFGAGDRRIWLVGVTLPPDVRAAEVDVFVPRPFGRRELVPTASIHLSGTEGDGPLLATASRQPWSPGTYRLRMRVDGIWTSLTLVIDADGR